MVHKNFKIGSMNKNKILYIVVAIVFISIIAYYIYNKSKSNNQELTEPNTDDAKRAIQPAETNLGTNEKPIFPIKRGDKGLHVQELQKGLNHQYFAIRKKNVLKPLDTDGDFGSKTLAMLKDLYNVSQVDKELVKRMYKDNGIVIMPSWIDNLK